MSWHQPQKGSAVKCNVLNIYYTFIAKHTIFTHSVPLAVILTHLINWAFLPQENIQGKKGPILI